MSRTERTPAISPRVDDDEVAEAAAGPSPPAACSQRPLGRSRRPGLAVRWSRDRSPSPGPRRADRSITQVALGDDPAAPGASGSRHHAPLRALAARSSAAAAAPQRVARRRPAQHRPAHARHRDLHRPRTRRLDLQRSRAATRSPSRRLRIGAARTRSGTYLGISGSAPGLLQERRARSSSRGRSGVSRSRAHSTSRHHPPSHEPVRGRRRHRRARVLASELSLDDIARRVASSRRQLQRAYAEIGGTTFRDHLTRVRMQRAAEMLAGADADGPRGRPPRRLPPAGAVRQGLPALPGRRARPPSAATAATPRFGASPQLRAAGRRRAGAAGRRRSAVVRAPRLDARTVVPSVAALP